MQGKLADGLHWRRYKKGITSGYIQITRHSHQANKDTDIISAIYSLLNSHSPLDTGRFGLGVEPGGFLKLPADTQVISSTLSRGYS